MSEFYDVLPVVGEPSEVLDLRLTQVQAQERMAQWAREHALTVCVHAGTNEPAFEVRVRTESGRLVSVHGCAFGAALQQQILERELGMLGLELRGVWLPRKPSGG